MHWQLLPPPASPQPLAATPVSPDLPSLDVPYEWNHPIRVLCDRLLSLHVVFPEFICLVAGVSILFLFPDDYSVW